MDKQTAQYSIAGAIAAIGATICMWLNRVGGWPASLIGMAATFGAMKVSDHYVNRAYAEEPPNRELPAKISNQVKPTEITAPNHLPNQKAVKNVTRTL